MNWVRGCFYSLTRGVRNVIRWTPVIWRDEDYDWTFLCNVMEWKLRKMSVFFKEQGHLVDSDKGSREMLICAELLKRIKEDDCGEKDIPYSLHEVRMNGWVKQLGKLMSRKLRYWWD